MQCKGSPNALIRNCGDSAEVDGADCSEVVRPVRGSQPQTLGLVVVNKQENMQNRPAVNWLVAVLWLLELQGVHPIYIIT